MAPRPIEDGELLIEIIALARAAERRAQLALARLKASQADTYSIKLIEAAREPHDGIQRIAAKLVRRIDDRARKRRKK